MINRTAAQRYVQQLLPMQLPYDHAYDRGWVYGLKVRRVFPEVCVHDDQVVSTIGNPGLHASSLVPSAAHLHPSVAHGVGALALRRGATAVAPGLNALELQAPNQAHGLFDAVDPVNL